IPAEDVAYCPDAHFRDGLLALAEKTIRAKSESPIGYVNRASFYSALGQFEKAKADAAKACALAERKPDGRTYDHLGSASMGSELYDGAITCYRKALELSPRNDRFHQNLGAALWRKGLGDESLSCFRTVLELNPRNMEGQRALGMSFERKGLWDQALSTYQKA